MSQNEADKKGSKRHWLKPLKGEWRASTHLLVWIDEKVERGRYVAARVQCSVVHCHADRTADVDNYSGDDREELESILDTLAKEKGTLTIWIPGGWEHFVLSGLADMVDKGIVTWRYLNIDGNRLLLRGQWRGKEIVVTSLGNWTGGSWDQWRGKSNLTGRALFLECFSQIGHMSAQLRLGSVAPSAGAAGLLCWRSWLGPSIKVNGFGGKKGAKGKGKRSTEFVGPVPSRPLRARNAERHCAYGLVVRQLRKGLVDEPIYCVDVSSAYLLYLISTPIPVMYSRTMHKPSPVRLMESLDGHTGCALVQIASPADPYPCRRNGKTLWATGNYWTWLAGAELAEALQMSRVTAVQTAHLWIASAMPLDRAADMLAWRDRWNESGMRIAAAAWRSVYSQLVGRFAAWRRTWVDCPAHQQFGRWSSWLQAEPETGLIVQHRSVAGRCQRLASKEDSGDSVPLLFGCVTAQGRVITRTLAASALESNVLAIEADSLWLSAAGWQSLQRHVASKGIAPDMLRCKERFDRAWMTGEHIAVVETDGSKYLRCPGVPSDVVVGSGGAVEWPSSRPWHEDGEPSAQRGVKRAVARMGVNKLLSEYSYPSVLTPWSDVVDDPMMGEELLQPLGAPARKVDDVE